MKILFLLKNFNPSGGVERITTRLIKELVEKDVETQLCVINNDHVDDKFEKVNFNVSNRFHFISKLRSHIKKEQVDCVISAKEQANFALFVASIGTKVNCLYVRHSSIGKGIGLFYSACILLFYCLVLLRRNNKIGCVSVEITEFLQKMIPFFKKRIIYLPNAVVDDRFYESSNEEITEDLRNKVDGSIITVSRLIKSKRIEDIINAYNIIYSKNKNLPNLIVVGDGPELERLELIVREYNLTSKVYFLGYVSNPYPLMKLSSIFILSSELEGMPTVLIEALALNKIVISSDCKTGPKELLMNGKCGYLYTVGDVAKLANTIEKAMIEPVFDFVEIRKIISIYSAKNSASSYLGVFINGK